jgi:hypothetical protein
MAFTTAQWDDRSRYDIGILDLATGAVRQLTSTGASDNTPVWSPDGTRIAFTRSYWDGRSPAACVIDVDGSDERCMSIPGGHVEVQRAWYDLDHLIVVFGPSDNDYLGRLHIYTGAVDTIVRATGRVAVSPDGKWIACRCRRPGFARDAHVVFPIDAPNRAVELDLSALTEGQVVVGWAVPPRRPQFAERLAIDTGLGRAILGTPHALRTVGLSSVGDSVDVRSVEWRSTDTTMATIDSAGVMIARRAGAVTIEASAGGWRTVRQRIAIDVPRVNTLIHEEWKQRIGPPWRAFGDPAPRIDSTDHGKRGMFNAGEGSHSSGVYTEREYSAARGLVLDAKVSAPINDEQWQVIGLAITAHLDGHALAAWDHVASGPPELIASTDWCNALFPGSREGAAYGDSIRFAAGPTRVTVRVPDAISSGEWFDVRIQLFPDGRCAFALNGVPLVVSTRRAVRVPLVRVILNGNSAWTKILVGETTLREGVPDDIDWSSASVRNPIPATSRRPAADRE